MIFKNMYGFMIRKICWSNEIWKELHVTDVTYLWKDFISFTIVVWELGNCGVSVMDTIHDTATILKQEDRHKVIHNQPIKLWSNLVSNGAHSLKVWMCNQVVECRRITFTLSISWLILPKPKTSFWRWPIRHVILPANAEISVLLSDL